MQRNIPMQRKKNIALFVTFLILLVWTIIFLNLEGRHSGLSLEENKFSVQDTSSIQEIRINGPSVSNTLSKVNGLWMVNEKYRLDPSMQKVLMSVLYQVKVSRTVPKNALDRIRDEVFEKGYRIEIIGSGGKMRVFYAGGNGISLSYFMGDDNIPFIVHLPGYESYVTGIFEVKENDWRDRKIFQTSWLGIKSIQITYPSQKEDNLEIIAKDNLYIIPGIVHLDTVALMKYLDEISYFYTDQFIDHGNFPTYDSLIHTEPYAHFRIDALGLRDRVNIDFFKAVPGEKVMLGVLNQDQMCLFSRQRIGTVFKKRSYFTVD